MRTLSSGLLAAQRASSGTPVVSLTVNATDYASRRKMLHHIERPYGGRATILLDNSDKAITADHRGDKVVIGYGFDGEGDSKAAPLWVLTQQDISYEGEVAVQLECIDIWLKLSLLRIIAGGGVQLDGTISGSFQPGMRVTGQTSGASGTVAYVGDGYIAIANVAQTFSSGETVQSDAYSDIKIVVSGVSDFGGGSPPAWNGDKTILEIIQQLTSGIVTVLLDSSDGIVDVYKPNYETVNNARIIDIIQDLMGKTTCGIRMENDDNLHIFDVSSPPGSPDYTYDTDHAFYSNLRDISSILPNRIIVVNAIQAVGSMTTYTGSAEDAAAQARFGAWVTQVIIANVQSDAEAGQVATSMLNRAQMEATRGTVEAPMNCGQELFDYVRITDTRAGIDYYGWVGSLEHRVEPGVYRLIIGLGNLVGGERIPSEAEYPLPNLPSLLIPAGPVTVPWVIPAAIQGFHHDLHFIAYDWDTITWGSGTIKFYDGTTQAVVADSYHIPDGAVRYIYFDLGDASPSSLERTDNYLSVMSVKTGVVCMVQRGSGTDVNATVIPSYGKEPLITADIIYLTGLLDKLPDGTYGKLLSTHLQAGKIKLQAGTVKDGEWYNESGLEIDATHGINIYGKDMALTTRATKTGTIQCYVGADGKIYAGAGAVALDTNGLTIKGQYLTLRTSAGVARGYIYGEADLTLLSVGGGIWLNAGGNEIWCFGNLIPSLGKHVGASGNYWDRGYLNFIYTNQINPRTTGSWIGTSGSKFERGYFDSLPSCPDGLPANGGLEVLRKVKAPSLKIAGLSRFQDSDFPSEMKCKLAHRDERGKLVEDKGEEIEYIRTIGVLVQAVRELADKVETLEAKK